MQIKFNTGRQYTTNGQRIAARLLDNGDVVFVDADRQIEGRIAMLCDREFVATIFDRAYVMDAYDSGAYSESQIDRELTRELRAVATA
tara:strand:+ start:643 stop:906 length:264 start_codon:yes stop_codon:yes gene_type:complete